MQIVTGEDIHGASNGFLAYLYDKFVYNRESGGQSGGWWGSRKTLNAFKPGNVPTNEQQRDIFALTLYPYLAVVEKMVQPRQILGGVTRGSHGVSRSRHNWPLGSRTSVHNGTRRRARQVKRLK